MQNSQRKSVCWSTLESCQSKSMQRPSNPRSTLIFFSFLLYVLCKPSYNLRVYIRKTTSIYIYLTQCCCTLLPFSRSYANTLNDGWQLCVYLTACHLLLVQEYLCLYISHQIIFYSLLLTTIPNVEDWRLSIHDIYSLE